MKIISQNFNTWTWKIVREMRTLKKLEFRHFWPKFTQKLTLGTKNNLQIKSQRLDIRTMSGRHPKNRTYGRNVGNLDRNNSIQLTEKIYKTWKETQTNFMEIHSESRSILVNRLHKLGSTQRFEKRFCR